MNSVIYKTKKINTVNTLTVEIEETFSNNYSIVIYDEEGDVFKEKFAKDYESATRIAEKLFNTEYKKY